jgi:putative polyhydroxyalkanoate system protein
MALTVEKKHTLPLDEAKKRAQELAEKFKTKLPIKELTWSPDGTKGKAVGKGFDAAFDVRSNTVSITVEFGIFLRPLAGQIEDSIRRSLDKAFA